MEIYDGRTFYIAKAFCIGKGGQQTCQWSSNYRTRLYTAFFVVARSYDGTIRTFDLNVTGRSSYRAFNLRAIGREPNPYKFAAQVAPLTTSIAHRENERGCSNYSP